MIYEEITNIEQVELIKGLARMVDQVCPPEPRRGHTDENCQERTTYPMSAYANAVVLLELYGLVTIVDRVYRVVTFKFNEGALEWVYGVGR